MLIGVEKMHERLQQLSAEEGTRRAAASEHAAATAALLGKARESIVDHAARQAALRASIAEAAAATRDHGVAKLMELQALAASLGLGAAAGRRAFEQG